ncbi:MAG: PASTA domain-containing protein [Lachnospiraceae bacterium]|nr:PASTA domain-containing protein [Lachnospiraceae bacterium]
MQKKPERRYQSAAELISDLKHAIMEPNVDFVIIPTDDMLVNSPTIALSNDDINAIRSGEMQNNMYANGMNQGFDPNGMNQMNQGYDQSGMNQMNQGYDQSGMNQMNQGYDQNGMNQMNQEYDPNGYQNGGMMNGYSDELSDPEEEKVPPKMEKMMLYIGIVVLVALVVLVIMFAKMLSGAGKSNNTPSEVPSATSDVEKTEKPTLSPDDEVVQVPKLINRKYEDAVSKAGDDFVVVQREEASKTIPEGYIIRQEPEAGEEAAKGSEIYVYVSTGDDSVLLEDVSKMQKEQAESKLKSTFKDIQIEYVMQADDKVDEGFVIKTEPEGGSEVSASLSSIKVFVSTGKEVVNVKVPNLVGKSLDQAIKTLKDNKLSLGTANETYNDSYPAGQVCEQKTSEGMLVPEGSSVNVVVSKGKKVTHYTYKINVNVSSSETNPFKNPDDENDTSDGPESGNITIKLYQGNTTIDTKSISSSYKDFASGGITYSFEYTTDNGSLSKSNFAVEFILNNKILTFSPSVSVSSPTED